MERKNKAAIAAKVRAGEAARAAYLQKQAERAAERRAFVAAGGVLPGGMGHGYTTFPAAAGGSGGSSGGNGNGPLQQQQRQRPKLHSGYAHFPME